MSGLLLAALDTIRSTSDFRDHLNRSLSDLFGGMDRAYRRAANDSGFICRGCKDNCCRSLFFHHTLSEHYWLMTGFDQLPAAVQRRVRRNALSVNEWQRQPSGTTGDRRPMCPLNEADRCILYAYRPMICRLHGVPSRTVMPGGDVRQWPGCDDYYRQCGEAPAVILDRSPVYQALARMEKDLRGMTGFSSRLKHTVADMIITMGGDEKRS